MRFRDLPIGEPFEFDHSGCGEMADVVGRALASGPWVRTHVNAYVHADDWRDKDCTTAATHIIGDKNAPVVRTS